jgi:predicted lactoylglutathione lyase
MIVEIYLQETSQRIKFENAKNTYTKGPMYCVMVEDPDGKRWVYKYPVENMFNVRESY